MSEAPTIADDMLRSYFERWQRLEEEKRTVAEDLKELFAEAKGNGFDAKVMRAVFRAEVGDQAELSEFEALCDLYRASLRKPRAHPARSAHVEKIEKNPGEHSGGEIKKVSARGTADEACSPIEASDRSDAGEVDSRGYMAASPPIPHSLPATSPGHAAKAGAVVLPPASATPFKLRPHCQHPANCAGYGSNHCHSCKVASATLQHGALA